jgi:hypothetical protein
LCDANGRGGFRRFPSFKIVLAGDVQGRVEDVVMLAGFKLYTIHIENCLTLASRLLVLALLFLLCRRVVAGILKREHRAYASLAGVVAPSAMTS